MIALHRSLLVLSIIVAVAVGISGTTSGSPDAEFQVRASRIAVNENYSWEVYTGEQLLFEAGSSGSDLSYSWDFGDGESMTTDRITITHAYDTTGAYDVILEVEDDEQNTDSQVGQITVVDRPEAKLLLRHPYSNAILDPDTYDFQPGDEVILDGSGSRGDIRIYYFGYDLKNTFVPQTQNTLPTMKIIYSEPGEYKLGLKVFDHLGNTSQTPTEDFITIQVGTVKDSGEGEDGQYSFQLDPFFATFVILGLIGTIIKVRGGRNSPMDDVWGRSTVPFDEEDESGIMDQVRDKEKIKPFHAQSVAKYQPILEPERTITSFESAPIFSVASSSNATFAPPAKKIPLKKSNKVPDRSN